MNVTRRNANIPLDLLNFSVAGLRDGIGPLLTLFLIQKTNWSPLTMSWVIATPGLADIFSQVPIGLLYDRIKDKRILLGLGAVLMASSAILISNLPNLAVTILVQAVVGVATCLISVGIPALSIASGPVSAFGTRLARNEIFSKFGNFSSLAITGYITQKYSLSWMFDIVLVSASLVLFSCLSIPRPARDNVATNHASKVNIRKEFRDAFQSMTFLRLLFLAIIFQFANASIFMIFEQSFVRQQANGGAGYVSASLFATQIVIMLMSIFIASRKKHFSAFNYLLLGFSLIAVRGTIYAFQFGLYSLAGGQLLDGAIAAILIIVPLRAIASLKKENFNLLSGVLGMGVALGASASTILAGFLIGQIGHVGSFVFFALVGLIGSVLTFMFKSQAT